MKKISVLKLDTDQVDGITNKLKFAARQLNDRLQSHTSGGSDEFTDLPTISDHN